MLEDRIRQSILHVLQGHKGIRIGFLQIVKSGLDAIRLLHILLERLGKEVLRNVMD